MKSPVTTPADSPNAPPPLSPLVRRVASVLIALHVFIVFMAPWEISCPSQVNGWVRGCVRYYLAAGFLNHGYNFFSPDPGEESHLVKYELRMPDGTETEGIFPNLATHRPRLLYHRHFMLTEFLNNNYEPAELPAEFKNMPEAQETHRARRENFLGVCRSYARHLLAATGADSVTLYRRRHRVPSPYEVDREGVKLDDPKLYEDEWIGVYAKDDFAKEAG